MEFDTKLQSIFNCDSCDKKTCTFGCPLNNDISDAIKAIKDKKYKKAYDIFTEKTVLMSICGRICPHERQCEGTCIKKHSKKKVKIGRIESFIGDMSLNEGWHINVPKTTSHNVAIVGGGPAGLTCAAFLRRNGIGVTIFEKHDYLGGILSHGIPEFRLPKKIVDNVINEIISMGISVNYNQELGKNLKMEYLKNNFDAIFLGIGANIANRMHIKGEKLDGVFGANEMLEEKIHVSFENKNVIVVGGGDVAMDISRTIKRNGAKNVSIIYRSEEKYLPANKREVKKAKREGIEFIYNTNIKSINGDDKVKSIACINTMTEIDENNKKSIKEITDTEKNIKCDYVILAIGSHAHKVVKKLNVELSDKQKIIVDKDGRTSDEKIFAGGDIASNKNTVAWAARAGRNAAYAIIDHLN